MPRSATSSRCVTPSVTVKNLNNVHGSGHFGLGCGSVHLLGVEPSFGQCPPAHPLLPRLSGVLPKPSTTGLSYLPPLACYHHYSKVIRYNSDIWTNVVLISLWIFGDSTSSRPQLGHAEPMGRGKDKMASRGAVCTFVAFDF